MSFRSFTQKGTLWETQEGFVVVDFFVSGGENEELSSGVCSLRTTLDIQVDVGTRVEESGIEGQEQG